MLDQNTPHTFFFQRLRTSLILFVCFTSSLFAEINPEKLLTELSLREKIAQLFIVSVSTDQPDSIKKALSLIEEIPYGGILFFKGSLCEQQQTLLKLQNKSSIPLLVTQDAEWGLGMRVHEGLNFPRNLTLGAANCPELVYQMGKHVAKQCKIAGVHINFAPVVDINNNPLNPVINDRAYGETEALVSKLATEFVKGLQDEGVLACAKHFPGHGDTHLDSHHTLPTIEKTQDQLKDLELKPFQHLIDQGLECVMLAHISFPLIAGPTPSSLSKEIIQDLLVRDLNFNGLVFSDSFEMKAIADIFPAGISDCLALQAGVDLILRGKDLPEAIAVIEKAVLNQEIDEEIINQKVLKVLKTKAKLKIDDAPISENTHFNSLDALALKKELYAKAITLLKNQAPFPIKTEKTIAFVQIGRDVSIKEATKKSTLTNEQQYPQKAPPLFFQLEETLPIDFFFLPKFAKATEIEALLEKLHKYPQVIIGCYEMNKYAQLDFGLTPSSLSFFSKLNQKPIELFTVLFGSPYSAKFFTDSKNLLIAYEHDADAQIGVSEVLTGKREAQGQMPVTACEEFPQGYRYFENQKDDAF